MSGDIINRFSPDERPPALEAYFVEAVDESDELASIVIPAFGPDIWRNVPWMPRGGTLPNSDDPCAVIMTEQRRPWIIAWWPT